MTVLVTGASGFIGSWLTRRLLADGRFGVRGAVRRDTPLPLGVGRVIVSDQALGTDWAPAVDGATAVIHLAARAHITCETSRDPLAEFRRVNVDGTERLARQAAAAGTRRFVFLSSVGVNGQIGSYTERDAPNPTSPYAISKHEAELVLRAVADETGMDVVIIRPPLVYGPGAPANFRSLVHAVASGWPLPLGAVHNRRSLVSLENLLDFIVTCVVKPAAAHETFLVSDGDDLSTTDLIQRLARAMGRRPLLLPVPEGVLFGLAALAGRREMAQKLLGSLQVDISKARDLLGWSPPCSVDEGLRQVASSL
jgi:nucleoside-diphosphate-sugar epimerase